MLAMFTLAHISDVHLPLDGRPHTRELIGKRILGYANWRRGRDDVHRAEVLEKITTHHAGPEAGPHRRHRRSCECGCRKREWSGARAFLDESGAHRIRVTLVPGNHDAYVGGSVPAMIEAFAPNMQGDTRV
jgi:3',5'-cyclic AMP phosphodiesterase CpdA